MPIVLVSIAVFLVLCLGGGTAIFLAVRNASDDTTTVTEGYTPLPTVEPTVEPTEEPTPDETTPTADPTPEKKISIAEPRTLGGRPRLTDAAFRASVDALRQDLEKIPGATDTVGGLYGTAAKRNVVVIAAVEAPVFAPETQLDRTFTSEGLGLEIRQVTTVEPGPLGGAAKCGRSSTSGIQIAMCAWADEGSAGWIIWYFKTIDQAKAEFVKLRGQIEKSS